MKKLLQALITSTLVASTATFAATFNCAANISVVLINTNGTVNVQHSGRGEYTHICSLKETRQGVDMTTCAMWTSMLLNLKNTNKQALFSYDTTTATSCANLPIYDLSPAPAYIGAI